MTKLTFRALAVFSLITSLTPLCMRAEGNARFKVPFGFTVGQKYLAPGNYGVVEMAPNVLQIRSSSSDASHSFIVNPADPGKHEGRTVLIFHRYGNQYFFSRMESPERGWVVLKSPREKELIASRSVSDQLTVVASAKH